jgi:hypothetical protein
MKANAPGGERSRHQILTATANDNEEFEYDARVMISPWGSVETDRDGGVAQVGWLITPKWEIAGRWAGYDPDAAATAENDQTEWRGGVSYYVNRHNWKMQADYGVTENEAAAATTNRERKELRVQAQRVF